MTRLKLAIGAGCPSLLNPLVVLGEVQAPHPLWRIIEDSHTAWVGLGKPGWERFGLTATPDHQAIWLDTPDCHLTWPLR